MAPRLRSAVSRFDALPEPVLRILFLALPVDDRARAACVCRSWRAFLVDPSLWQVLDLTATGGVAAERVTENLVRGAVSRAAGHLRVLSLNRVPAPVLVQALVSDGAELQQVDADVSLSRDQLRNVFAAAPRLQVLNANVTGYCTELLPVLRNDPPFGPLRVSGLNLQFDGNAAVLALAAAVAAHESLESLTFRDAHIAPGPVNALLDAVAQQRVSWLMIHGCDSDVESVHALARLLQRGSLIKLDLMFADFPRAQEESMPVLCAALRACPSLTNLTLYLNPPGGASHRTIAELLDAVAALPELSVLDLSHCEVHDTTAFGHAFGALLRANRPCLHTLGVQYCELDDEALAPILDGLAANTHLRELGCEYNRVSEAFRRDLLEPALAALAARAQLDA
jgi:molybdopterin-guanine dinucleotide biosynthesis protein A